MRRAIAVFALLDPMSLVSGPIFKVLIIVVLAKSIQAALAYQREKNQAESYAEYS